MNTREKSIVLLCIGCISISSASIGLADEIGETDIFGNVIDWDVNESAYEENQLEGDIKENTISIPESSEENTLETSEIETSSIADTEDFEKAATVYAHFSAPNNWGMDDISFCIYNLDENMQYNIFLAHDLGYKGKICVHPGNFEVRGANIIGDAINGQPIYCEISNFTINKNEEITLELRPAQQEIADSSETSETTETAAKTTISVSKETEPEDNHISKNKFYNINAIIVLSVVCFLSAPDFPSVLPPS